MKTTHVDTSSVLHLRCQALQLAAALHLQEALQRPLLGREPSQVVRPALHFARQRLGHLLQLPRAVRTQHRHLEALLKGSEGLEAIPL